MKSYRTSIKDQIWMVFAALLTTATMLFLAQPDMSAAQHSTIPSLAPGIVAYTTYPINPMYCINDVGGANDYAGQKDLTRLCIDTYSDPLFIQVEWGWDETGTSGANSMDVATFFDTDGDGLANYAAYVQTNNNPATMTIAYFASCDDTSNIQCGNAITLSNITTNCEVHSPVSNDPFPSGASYPNDTVGYCKLPVSLFPVAAPEILNTCSLPSSSISSVRSDCTAVEGGGFITVKKLMEPNDPSYTWNFSIDYSGGNAKIFSILGSGQQIFSLPVNTYSVGEIYSPDYSPYTLYSSSCTNNGTPVGAGFNPITGIALGSGKDVVCEFVNAVPTAIDVASFEATSGVNMVNLVWTSVSEIDITGYHIYRSIDPAIVGTKINTNLIPAQYSGQLIGGTYGFVDRNARFGHTYFYNLQLVNIDNSVQLSDQVFATPTGYTIYVPLTMR